MFSTSLSLVLGAVLCNGVLGVPAAPTSEGENVGHYAYRSHALVLTSQQDIVWESCDNFGVERPLPGLYCANVEVPMDYHDSSAGTANLAVIKYTAAGPGKSKGSVFVNPGTYSCRTRVVALTHLWKVVLVCPEPLLSRPLVNP